MGGGGDLNLSWLYFLDLIMIMRLVYLDMNSLDLKCGKVSGLYLLYADASFAQGSGMQMMHRICLMLP